MKYISGNENAEAKVQSIHCVDDGRKVFNGVKELFEGSGINSIDIAMADIIICTLNYMGEKKPLMWWEEYEKKLCWVFATYNFKENCMVYSDEMKLRILNEKSRPIF